MRESLRFEAAMLPDAGHRDDLSRECWLFPGLGCRHVGMGHDLFGRPGITQRMFRLAEEMLGYHLAPICLEGSGRKVVPPRQEAQIIYVLNCAYAAALGELGHRAQAVLGHSLGSWAAAWAAGTFDFLTGLELVTHVERLFEELVDDRQLCMGSMIGLHESTVQSEVAKYPGVSVANYNSPNQFVVGGPASEVDRVLDAASALGAKQAKRLPTSRAVHTPWMEAVSQQLTRRLELVTWSDPQVPFVTCDNAEQLATGKAVQQFFSIFLTRPVRWETSFCRLRQIRSSQFLEVGPGTLLMNLASFIDPVAVVRTASDVLDVAP